MNYVICLYILYLLIVSGVVGWAGWQLYLAGRPFVRVILYVDDQKADWINALLLTGYYLVCTGYSFMVLSSLPAVASLPAMITALSIWVGRLVIILSLLHYINMLVFSLWKKFHNV